MYDINTRTIKFSVNGEQAPGYMAQPDDDAVFPAVVVIQEWWGLDDHIMSVADRIASEGYVAIAPDFYRGEVAGEPDDARRLAMQLERPKARKDVQGAIDYLLSLPNVAPKKAGIVGFCMGGAIAGSMSYQGKNVGAVVSFYGGGFKIDDEIAGAISAPFLGIYGEDDHGIPQEMVRENERQLKEKNIPHEIIVYPAAPHAFFNDTRQSYRPDAAADAWSRTLEWFEQYLTD
jgi:carboxymethylenebutenolidase